MDAHLIMDAHLLKKENILKVNILAPFIKRYRYKKSLNVLSEQTRPLIPSSILFANGKALLIKNPKSATTSLAESIFWWETGRHFKGENIHGDRSLKQGIHNYPRLVEGMLDESCLKVTVVRDPLSRCVSGFKNFVLAQNNISAKRHIPFLKKLGLVESSDASKSYDIFLDYIQLCKELSVKRMDPHFRPQIYNLRPDLVKYGFIGRVEHLGADIKKLEMRLGLKSINQNLQQQEQIKANPSRVKFEPSQQQRIRTNDLFSEDYNWLKSLFPGEYEPKD